MSLHIRHRQTDTPVRRVLLSIICTLAIGAISAWVLPNQPVAHTPSCQSPHVWKPIAENAATPPPIQPVELALVNAPEITNFLELSPAPQPQNINLNIEIPIVCAIDESESFCGLQLMPAPEALPTQQPQTTPRITSATASNIQQQSVYTPPQYIYTPQPKYPEELQRRRIAGEVRVRIHVDASGKALAVDILASPHPKLSQSVRHTVLHFWRFRAASQGKKLIASTVVTSVLFEL